MDTTHLFIATELRRTENRFAHALRCIPQARDLRELVRAADVHVPAAIRHLSETRRLTRQIKGVAEKRAREIVAQQIGELEKATTKADLVSCAGRYRPQWECLRGRFPMVHTETMKALARVQAAASFPPPPNPAPCSASLTE